MKFLLMVLMISIPLSALAETDLERDIRIEQEQKTKEKAMHVDLRPGMKLSEIQKSWGTPDSTVFYKGILIYKYNNDDYPLYMGFKHNKLVQWQFDENEARGIRQQHELERQENARYLAQQEEIAREKKLRFWRALGAGFQTMGNSISNSARQNINCTSNRIGNSVYTNCN